MPFASALSTEPNSSKAVAEVLSATNVLPGPPNLAVVFFSNHHLPAAANIAVSFKRSSTPIV